MQDQGPLPRFGVLAQLIGKQLPLQVLKSQAGYYLGTSTDEGPCSRESKEYWRRADQAQDALKTGAWTQRPEP